MKSKALFLNFQSVSYSQLRVLRSKTDRVLCSQSWAENKYVKYIEFCWYCSVAQSCPLFAIHGLQHARVLCPPLSPRVCSDSYPLSQWCYLTISPSTVPFSFCLQSSPASGSFAMSQAVVNGMYFNGWKRNHGVTQALNLGQKGKRPGLVEALRWHPRIPSNGPLLWDKWVYSEDRALVQRD